MMKCMRCGKDSYKSTTTEAIEMDCGLLIIRNIPCYKCKECDEIFYTGDVVLPKNARKPLALAMGDEWRNLI
ncbi:MAG: YgiT-type zinc finger protein [Synergistaceae bacterium]|nr:YgiT-type zinc finger protein [Synergistaceae bacterium]